MSGGDARSASSIADAQAGESSVRPLDGDARSAGLGEAVNARSTQTPAPRRGVWVLLAAVTCPCHVPIYVALLSGTAAGSLLSDNMGVAALALGIVFLGSVATLLRAR